MSIATLGLGCGCCRDSDGSSHLATRSSDGRPLPRTVAFGNDGDIVLWEALVLVAGFFAYMSVIFVPIQMEKKRAKAAGASLTVHTAGLCWPALCWPRARLSRTACLCLCRACLCLCRACLLALLVLVLAALGLLVLMPVLEVALAHLGPS